MAKIIERPEVGLEDLPLLEADKPEGPVAAALIAGGVGCAALGFLTTLAEANAGAKSWLEWNARVGPLSGKTGMAVIVWLVAWVALHFGLRKRSVDLSKVFVIGLVLVGLGLLGTFPTFFQAFASE